MSVLMILAVVIPLVFTAPDTGSSAIRRYEARRVSQLDGIASATLYADSLARDTSIIVADPGQPQRVWVSLTTSPNAAYGTRRGGQSIQVRARAAGGGVGPWSNPVDVAAGCVDSLYCNGRVWALPGSDHVVRFRRSVDDTSVVDGPIKGYEDAMVRDAWNRYICGFAGKWALKGAWQVCP